jgi:feruloyl-CoA synthase
MMRQVWPFLAGTPLTLVDWLPWSHTFGGNHNLNMVLGTGGTLYIDDGGPTPELFPASMRRLAGLSPNVYFNVPAGFELLAAELERDPEFAARFFARLRLMLSAGAPLREPLRRRILAVAKRVAGHPVCFTSSWGLTETSSAVTSAHLPTDEPAAIGVPLPGISLKLTPVGDKWEMRVAGPTVMPHYLHAEVPDTFDDEGYYRTGDAGLLIDHDDPGKGLTFDGRIAENFKLATGTWVHVGALRSELLSATDVLADVVITGHGRPSVGALAWLKPGVHDTAELRSKLAGDLAAVNGATGSSRRVERLLLMSEPPSRAAGELSDKGSLNQRRVLERRQDLVSLLYRDPAPADVIRDRPQRTPTGKRPDHARP